MTPDLSLAAAAQAALVRDPARAAIEFAGRWWTWGEVAAAAGALTQALADLGVRSPAPIAFVPRNRPSSLAALLGLVAGGHDVLMHYAFQPPQSVAAAVQASGAAVAVIESEDAALLAALVAADVPVAVLHGAQVATHPGCRGDSGCAGTGTIAILTSGTTGPPKHMRLPAALVLTHHVGRDSLSPERAAAHAAAPPALLYFPLANISGVYSTLPPLLRGQRVVLLDRFSLDAWRAYVRDWRPVHSGIPPAAMAELLDADIPAEELSSLRTMGLGAAPLDPELHRRFEERYAIPILLSYGATEFAGPVCVMTPELHAAWGAAKRGSVGRALPGAKLRVVDPESGAALPAGSEGLLEVVSPRLGPEWIRTADVAMLDADDFLWLRGRADGAIIRGGFKLLPESIEQVVNRHPAVAESAVTGLADPRLGQIPVAIVRLKSGFELPDAIDLDRFARTHLPATHVPAKWKIVEQIPRNISMKIDRAAVVRLLSES